MDTSVVYLILLVAGVLVAVRVLRAKFSETGTHADLTARLTELKKETSPSAFVGFRTKDEDALYYVYLDGVFYLDYELTTPQKKAHADEFRIAAGELGFAVIDTTYSEYPLLRVMVGSEEARAAKAGAQFAERLFGQDEKTVVEFLP